MLVFDNNNQPLILDDIYTPTVADHVWVLDFSIMDFTLAPLMILEEIVAPTIELNILGFAFNLPANWNILVVDDETAQLDVVEISEVAGREFKAFLYGPYCSRHEATPISVSNYYPQHHNVGPSLYKYQMLCHPVAPDLWVNVAPSDAYNKYLKDIVAGDLT
jgi:hypothetical protein